MLMIGQYLKSVVICFGFVLFGWAIFEMPISVFGLLALGCLFAPLMYHVLMVKLATPQTEEYRRKQLQLTLLKNVAYKPAERQTLDSSTNRFSQDRRQKK